MTGDDAERFNPAALDMLVRVGDGTLLIRMVDIFLKNGPERLRSARDGVASGDRRAVELAAHSLKSSSAQLGGPALQRASLVVEQDAATGTPDALLAGLDVMQTEFDALREWLERARADAAARLAQRGTPPGGPE